MTPVLDMLRTAFSQRLSGNCPLILSELTQLQDLRVGLVLFGGEAEIVAGGFMNLSNVSSVLSRVVCGANISNPVDNGTTSLCLNLQTSSLSTLASQASPRSRSFGCCTGNARLPTSPGLHNFSFEPTPPPLFSCLPNRAPSSPSTPQMYSQVNLQRKPALPLTPAETHPCPLSQFRTPAGWLIETVRSNRSW